MWLVHGFICIKDRAQEQSKHGRKIAGMKDQFYTMRKRKYASRKSRTWIVIIQLPRVVVQKCWIANL